MTHHHTPIPHTPPSSDAPRDAARAPSHAFIRHQQNHPTTLDILHTTLIPATDPSPLTTLQSLLTTTPTSPTDHWLLTLSYDLAHTLEPSIPASTSTFPHIIAQRCRPTDPSIQHTPTPDPAPWSVDPAHLTLIPKHHYLAMVRRAKDYIAAGDIYQVNLAHPITLPFTGSSAALAQHLFNATNPAMGSFTTFDTNPKAPNAQRHAIIALSPETFLTYDAPTRTLTTEPMKGTRPAAADPEELRTNPKDRAELNMIIDLMRNDLGRIATPGSVAVTHPRTITLHHNSVHQATATIRATLRNDRTLTDILAATFPPGSITGAPKVRAMQIIHELESTPPTHTTPRAPYCGSTLLLHPNTSFTSAVNIRTLHIQGTPSPQSPDAFESATLTYHAGAGIVADSDPESEWQETLAKAAILESALHLRLPADPPPPNKR